MSVATPSGLLLSTHDLCRAHDTGPGHPERPDRLLAVKRGIELAGLDEAIIDPDTMTGPQSAAAALRAVGAGLGESHRPETPTTDGPGVDAVDQARRIHLDRRLEQ